MQLWKDFYVRQAKRPLHVHREKHKNNTKNQFDIS